MTTTKYFFLLIVLVAGWSFNARAQSTHLTAQNLGLGGGGTAYVEGYHANFINPANLMLGEDEPQLRLGVIGGISGSMGGPLANIHVYNTYFTNGLTISGSIAEEALTKWFGSDPNEMRYFSMQTDVIPVGLSFRSENWGIGLAVRSRILMDTGINKGFAQLGILGLNSGVFGNGQPVNFSAETISFYEASAGISVKLLEIESLFGFAENVRVYAGVAPKMLLGANAFMADFNSVLTLKGAGEDQIDEIRHDFQYRFETTGEITDQLMQYYHAREDDPNSTYIENYVNPVAEDLYGIKASGWGLDLGSTIEMDLNIPVIGAFFKGAEHLRVGLSLTDMGSLSFTEQAGVFMADEELVWQGFEFDEEEINQEYNGDRNEYITHVLQDSIMTGIYGSFTPQNGAKVTRTLPMMVHFGTHLVLNKLSLSVDLSRGFNDVGTNSQRVALSTGLEYNLLGFLPLRVGVRTGGYSSTSYSAGLGLEFTNFEFSVAASTVSNSLENGTHIGAAWSGLVFKF